MRTKNRINEIMKIEKVLNGIRYTLSNENLMKGDSVFPIASGRVTDNDEWILHTIEYKPSSTGFPDEPHIIKDLEHSTYKPYQIHTNHGYGPIETYYKIIKKEHKVSSDIKFTHDTWEIFE